jgi:flagellar protein FliL
VAEPETPPDAAPRKTSKLPLILAVVGALVLGVGGFYATYSGLVFGHADDKTEEHVANMPDIAFVPVDPLVISLPPGSGSKHLRFSSQLEVAGPHASEVMVLMPRILDVLNGYLRAVETKDLEDPSALVRLRAQMLRRVQIVTGEGRVRDLLITEFVLN